MNLMPCYVPGYEKQKQEKLIEKEARSTEVSSFFFFFFAFPYFSSFFYCFLMLVNKSSVDNVTRTTTEASPILQAVHDHRTDLVLIAIYSDN